MSILLETQGVNISNLARLKHRFMVARQDPTIPIGLCLIALFLWLIAAPLTSIFADVFSVQIGDEARTGAEVGQFTDYYMIRVFVSRISSILFWKPLWNTLTVAVSSMGLALLSDPYWPGCLSGQI